MDTLRVEFRAMSDPVSLTATADGKMSTNVVAAGSTMTFEPRESLKLSYSRSLAQNVELVINGKSITPPAEPSNPKRAVIEFEINKDNLTQIWNSGSVTVETPVEPEVRASTPATQTTPASHPSPTPKNTPPANTITRPASNTMRPIPAPSRKVIIVGNANRP
jgi:hypothetical protein